MARTIKKGLDYFPFDVDFFQDIRIRKLIKYQGGKAITVYALLLCNIYRNGYYAEWDKELPFIISEQSGYTEAYIQEVIDCCLSIGLLSKDLFDSAKILTSKGIQERYRRICTASRRNVVISDYSLLPDCGPNAVRPSARLSRVPGSAQEIPPHRGPNAVRASQPPQSSPAPAKPYSASIDEEVAEMKRSSQWKESVCTRYGLDPKKMDFYLGDFSLKCSKRHTSLQDARSHFCYWLQERLKQNRQKPQPAPVSANANPYKFDGGFGGKDI